MKQLSHNEIENNLRKFPISLVCDAIRTPENIGMCFRIAESFGVEKIYLHESSANLDNRKVRKTARNTIDSIEYARYSNFDELLVQLKNKDTTIIGLEITDNSSNIQNFDFKAHSKIVLIIGSERNGIQSTKLIDNSIAIPMFGKNSSMNVVHSLAIALYEITNQFS